MFYFDATITPDAPTVFGTAKIIELAITGVLAALVTWFFTRRKSESEIDKNESDADKNHADEQKILYETIRGLRGDINGFIAQMDGLKKEADTLEQESRNLNRRIEDLKKEQSEKLERLHDFIVRVQMSFAPIEATIMQTGTSDLKREAVRISEMLFSLKHQLEG